MWKTTARVSAIGLEMALAIAIGYGIGWWLDRRYDTKPRYMIIFLLIGVGAGFRGLIRVAQEERARQRKASKEASAAAPQPDATKPVDNDKDDRG